MKDSYQSEIIRKKLIESLETLPQKNIEDSKHHVINDEYTIKFRNEGKDRWHNIGIYQFIPEHNSQNYIGWINITNELQGDKLSSNEGMLNVYRMKENISKIEKLHQIEQGKSFWEKTEGGIYKKMICKNIEQIVKRKNGRMLPVEKDFESIKLNSQNIWKHRDYVETNPEVNRFYQMEFFPEKNESESISIKEGQNFDFYFSGQYPRETLAKEEIFNMLNETLRSIGIETISKKPTNYEVKEAFKMKFKI